MTVAVRASGRVSVCQFGCFKRKNIVGDNCWVECLVGVGIKGCLFARRACS